MQSTNDPPLTVTAYSYLQPWPSAGPAHDPSPPVLPPHLHPRVQPRRISTVMRSCTVSTYGTSPICRTHVQKWLAVSLEIC